MTGNRLLVLLALAASAAPLCALTQPVKTSGGLVSGVAGTDKSIVAFKGMPFAAPPAGDLRWRAPAPAKPWQGVLKAEKFSASCMQTIVQERPPWTYEFMTHTEVSEDCLYLNVWTGAKSAFEKRPVFLYIYGGGFTEGSAAVPVYDGEGLAKKGLVVVTIAKDLIPFIDANFRTIADKGRRAFAGLSMGGAQAMRIGADHPEAFTYIGLFSPAIGYEDPAEDYDGKLADAAGFNKKLNLLWIGIGTEDSLHDGVKATHENLEKAGIRRVWVESSGAHVWTVWRKYLADFAPRLFK